MLDPDVQICLVELAHSMIRDFQTGEAEKNRIIDKKCELFDRAFKNLAKTLKKAG